MKREPLPSETEPQQSPEFVDVLDTAHQDGHPVLLDGQGKALPPGEPEVYLRFYMHHYGKRTNSMGQEFTT